MYAFMYLNSIVSVLLTGQGKKIPILDTRISFILPLNRDMNANKTNPTLGNRCEQVKKDFERSRIHMADEHTAPLHSGS